MKKYLFIILLVGLGFSQNYNLNQYVLSSSAINSTNGQQTLTGILGQSIVGESQNSNNILYSGFWGYISYGFLETDEPIIPKEFQVSNSYPNPFNPKTKIDIAIPEASKVSIRIYDILGNEVFKWDENFLNSGYYNFYWHGINNQGDNISSGTYIVLITNGKKTFSQKITLLK